MGNGYPHSTIAQILEDIISQLSFEGESHSNIADILLSILNQTSYDKEPYSVLAELFLKLKAKIEGVPFDPYDKETHSVIADILVSILNETEYTDMPQSRIAELLLELKEELESYTEITVSGSIVSFTTNVSKPLVKLKADVVATQSGSGTPYPAGGGKNKLDPSLLKDQVTWHQVSLTLTPNTQYVMSSNISQDKTSELALFFFNSAGSPSIGTLVYSGHPITITTKDDGIARIQQRRVTGSDSFQNYQWQLEAGSSATSYAPYENIRPITGWSSANVTRTGKNLWDEEWELGIISTTTGQNLPSNTQMRSVNYIPIKPSTTYRLKVSSTSGIWCAIEAYKSDKSFLQNLGGITNGSTFTTPADCYFIRFYTAPTYGTTYNNNISINYPSTDTAYHAYNGNTYTIAFGNTYYGCELVVIDGSVVLRVVRGYKTFNGGSDESWTAQTFSGNTICFTPISDKKVGYQTSFCDKFKNENASWGSTNTAKYSDHQSNTNLYFCKPTDDFVMNKANWLTWLSSNPVSVCYELATPIEIQLTPIEIDTLAGDNVIFADTGDVEVTYLYKGTPET